MIGGKIYRVSWHLKGSAILAQEEFTNLERAFEWFGEMIANGANSVVIQEFSITGEWRQ